MAERRRRPGRARCLAAGLALLLAGCMPQRSPVPEALVETANVPGYSGIRFWGDDADSIGTAAILAEAAESRTRTGDPHWYFLSISGGGSDGAFGAGLLTGWSENGTRPEFDIVTGISTGSLIAPFAFLGPAWDPLLTHVYTDISGPDIFRPMGLLGAVGVGAFDDDAPLRALVDATVTDTMVADIAREHRRGRRLLVGTTNLDADRPVVWDIGAIAASAQPGRRALIRDVLVASASIPGLFPPARIEVVADGVAYDEMHVDGGTTNQAFLFPDNFTEAELDLWTDSARTRSLYVIRNGRVDPVYSPVAPHLTGVVRKSVSLLIRTQGVGDLSQMFETADRVGVDFNAIWIPAEFTLSEPRPFDRDYMRAVYALGHGLAENGIPWIKRPPE
jgi:hypothetical protein